ncbi:hypothetical protein [Streptomyces sp. NPDC020983]|uniref:hypothetical protein n=1 Tax=Streptomyces sp. NPDC020983 TaxID=3365106 RepID=UPI00378976C4
MAATAEPEPALLDPKGPVITAVACVVGVLLAVAGCGGAVVCAVLAVTGAGGTHGGLVPVAGVLAVFGVFVCLVGYSTAVNARQERELTLRLAAGGLEATALVLAVASAPPTHDDHPQVRLRLRIGGAGVEPFEVEVEVHSYRFGAAAQGTVLPARVDPVSLVFTLGRPAAPPAPAPGG